MVLGAVAALIIAMNAACNPMVAISNDAKNLSTLRDLLQGSSTLSAVRAVSAKGRLAVVKDNATLGTGAGRWLKTTGPAAVLAGLWNAAYVRDSPRDPYRTFTFVQVLNAQGSPIIMLSPQGCL